MIYQFRIYDNWTCGINSLKNKINNWEASQLDIWQENKKKKNFVLNCDEIYDFFNDYDNDVDDDEDDIKMFSLNLRSFFFLWEISS